ncbi:MAG: hypothetical protein ACPGYL_09965, partial [Rhodospirillaceae bacterium]
MIVLFVVFVFGIVAVTFFVAQRQSQDALIIDLAGSQSLLVMDQSRLFTELALAIESESSTEELTAALIKDRDLFERGLTDDEQEEIAALDATIADLEKEGAEPFDERIRKYLGMGGEPLGFTAEPKIDGLSLSIRYENG